MNVYERHLWLEERKAQGVHRWDYENPGCLWEEWPWWFRWPAAFLGAIYLISGAVSFTAAMLR